MIAKVTGTLESVGNDRALIALPGGGISIEVLLPAFTVARLHGSVGESLTLHTIAFLEGSSQGSSFIPRLAGFASVEDREFYRAFTTVKGIGNRKALRAMAINTGSIAAAIEDRDLGVLQSLPEIGRRSAETIVATLRGKVGQFVDSGGRVAVGAGGRVTSNGGGRTGGSLSKEALTVLVQLGERRQDAAAWIDQVLAGDEPPTDVQGVIAEVYRIKATG